LDSSLVVGDNVFTQQLTSDGEGRTTMASGNNVKHDDSTSRVSGSKVDMNTVSSHNETQARTAEIAKLFTNPSEGITKLMSYPSEALASGLESLGVDPETAAEYATNIVGSAGVVSGLAILNEARETSANRIKGNQVAKEDFKYTTTDKEGNQVEKSVKKGDSVNVKSNSDLADYYKENKSQFRTQNGSAGEFARSATNSILNTFDASNSNKVSKSDSITDENGNPIEKDKGENSPDSDSDKSVHENVLDSDEKIIQSNGERSNTKAQVVSNINDAMDTNKQQFKDGKISSDQFKDKQVELQDLKDKVGNNTISTKDLRTSGVAIPKGISTTGKYTKVDFNKTDANRASAEAEAKQIEEDKKTKPTSPPPPPQQKPQTFWQSVASSRIGQRFGLGAMLGMTSASVAQASGIEVPSISSSTTPTPPTVAPMVKQPQQSGSSSGNTNSGGYMQYADEAMDSVAVGFNALTGYMGMNEMKNGTKATQILKDTVDFKGATKGASGLGKMAMKKLPFVGLALSAKFASDRMDKGDYAGASMEMLSGALSMFPGIGTMGSAAIDNRLAGTTPMSTPSYQSVIPTSPNPTASYMKSATTAPTVSNTNNAPTASNGFTNNNVVAQNATIQSTTIINIL